MYANVYANVSQAAKKINGILNTSGPRAFPRDLAQLYLHTAKSLKQQMECSRVPTAEWQPYKHGRSSACSWTLAKTVALECNDSMTSEKVASKCLLPIGQCVRHAWEFTMAFFCHPLDSRQMNQEKAKGKKKLQAANGRKVWPITYTALSLLQRTTQGARIFVCKCDILSISQIAPSLSQSTLNGFPFSKEVQNLLNNRNIILVFFSNYSNNSTQTNPMFFKKFFPVILFREETQKFISNKPNVRRTRL